MTQTSRQLAPPAGQWGSTTLRALGERGKKVIGLHRDGIADARGRRPRRRPWHLPRASIGMLISDGIALLTAATLTGQHTQSAVMLSVLVVAALQGAGLYRTRLTLSVLDDLPALLGGISFATLGATLITMAAVGLRSDISAIVIQSVVIAVLVVVGRTGAYATIRWARGRRLSNYRTLIVGCDEVGARLGTALNEHPEHGLRLVGFVDDHPVGRNELPAPVLGTSTDLAAAVERERIAVVVVAFGAAPAQDLIAPLRGCATADCQIFVVPRLFELPGSGHGDRIRAIPLIRLPRSAVRGVSWRVKRLFDIVVAGFTLLLFSPLLAAIALAVRRECGPDVLFRQQRVGLGGREFTMYKFRSLTPIDDNESQTRWSVANDGRMGPVGKLIRRTSLDELPQLFNVLRGDMSIVGPRPERPFFVEKFSDAIDSYADRHRVPAGLTGWAAVSGLRGDTSIEERAHYDNFYIDNWSLWLDMKIVLWTLPVLLRGHDG
jgi:exopolysaccharide biosynthesis polyprenyl glycosylphosphotransferase